MIESAGLIVKENGLLVLACVASVTSTVNVAVVAAVGVPLRTPPEERLRFAGSVPAVINQLYGDTPPEAVSVCEYATPVTAAGKGELVVIESGAVIVSVKSFDTSVAALSFNVTVTEKLPAELVVPVIWPLDWPIDNPDGSPDALQV